MLAPELIRKIKRLHVRSGRLVDTMFAGRYRSVFRGRGMEFEEVREYAPGDEVKSIDWKVSGRMGKPYIKLFREERELTLMLLVDVSGSGVFGTRSEPGGECRTKSEKMAEIAAVLAFTAIRNNDRVGLVLFSDRVERYIPPKKGSAHVWRVIKEIMGHESEGRGTDLSGALEFLGKVARKRCVAFVVSDFLAPDFGQRLRASALRHEVAGVAVTDPGDGELPRGLVELRDPENGGRMLLDGGDAGVREAYARLRAGERAKALAAMRGAGVDCVEISTDQSTAEALHMFFRARERARGRRS